MGCLVIGAGLTGAVIARHLAEHGESVKIWERRNHIGGNLYDYIDKYGFLVQKYGPHAFHTKKEELFDYMCRFEQWQDYRLICGAVWDGRYTPIPFNFTTIDIFYPNGQAERLKQKLLSAFTGQKSAVITDMITHPDPDICSYAEFLFRNDYAPYTAKQWGVQSTEIDSSILKRVPIRFSYEDGYFDDPYQIMPVHSFGTFFENLLKHPEIKIELNKDALQHLDVQNGMVYADGMPFPGLVVYTGALDELFRCIYGNLPYRSLRFDWKYSREDSVQKAPVVAYPQAKGYTRITEYKKLPVQKGAGSSYVIEYPLPYFEKTHEEPYYPVLTDQSQTQYMRYRALAERISNLVFCGRLADFRYYNMDQALERALAVCKELDRRLFR